MGSSLGLRSCLAIILSVFFLGAGIGIGGCASPAARSSELALADSSPQVAPDSRPDSSSNSLASPQLTERQTAVTNSPLRLNQAVFATAAEPFLSHQGRGAFDNYLAMSIPYAPIRQLYEDLERQLGMRLKNRGEAHITVITPPEYSEILKNHVSIAMIERLAVQAELQKSRFEIVCLGRGQAVLGKQVAQTYFVVVKSDALVRLRETIFRAYAAGGGDPSRFDPKAFYPHITVGFTHTDLHESQGVKKGVNSCFAPLEIKS